MNISPSDQENSKVPSHADQASGEVTDRLQVALPGSSNTKTIKNENDTDNDNDMEKTIQKDIAETSNKTLSPTKNDMEKLTTAAPITELDAVVENEREDSGSPSPDAKSIVKEDIVDETNKKPATAAATATDTTASSNSSTEAVCADTAPINSAEPNPNADVKNADSNNDGAAESKEAVAVAVTEAPKKRARKKWKKPPGKPNRPLSAYNLYFRKERALMLGDAAEKTDQEEGKKRVHRKTHGKIGFAEMARIIGAKWKSLPEEDKVEFVKVAAVEKERYAKDLAKWREEQKQKAIINSMGSGRKSKIGKLGAHDDDDLIQSIAEDREKLLRQHQAFRMQMMQEMQVGHLGRLPGEGHGRQMPTIDYLRNMPDERTGQFFGRNRNGAPSSLFSHYPSAAEGSGRDLYQQMAAMTSGPEGPGREPDQSRQFKMSRMQNGPGGAMGEMGPPMGAPMGNTMGNPMGNNGMGNTMGMTPINNGASQMSNPAPYSQYEMERFQHMRYQNQMNGMHNNQVPMSPGRTNGPRGPSGFQHHNRYN